MTFFVECVYTNILTGAKQELFFVGKTEAACRAKAARAMSKLYGANWRKLFVLETQ